MSSMPAHVLCRLLRRLFRASADFAAFVDVAAFSSLPSICCRHIFAKSAQRYVAMPNAALPPPPSRCRTYADVYFTLPAIERERRHAFVATIDDCYVAARHAGA